MTQNDIFIKGAERATLIFSLEGIKEAETGANLDYRAIDYETYKRGLQLMPEDEQDELLDYIGIVDDAMQDRLINFLNEREGNATEIDIFSILSDAFEDEGTEPQEGEKCNCAACQMESAEGYTVAHIIGGVKYTINITADILPIDQMNEADLDDFEAEMDKVERLVKETVQPINKMPTQELKQMLTHEEAKGNYELCAVIRDEINERLNA